ILKEIKVGEGKTVPIQTVVGTIDSADGAAAAPAKAAAPPAPAKPAPTPQAAKPAAVAPPPPPQKQSAPAPQAAAPARDGARIHSSPLVRRMAKEHGIDLASVPGTGQGGRISKQDIEAYISGGVPAAAGASEEAAEAYTPQTSAPAPRA